MSIANARNCMLSELRKGKRFGSIKVFVQSISNSIVSFSFFVTDAKENVSTTWWNSEQNGAAHINFLNTTAVDWFNARLKRLYTSYGINTFKFDGGEVDLIPWVRISQLRGSNV